MNKDYLRIKKEKKCDRCIKHENNFLSIMMDNGREYIKLY